MDDEQCPDKRGSAWNTSFGLFAAADDTGLEAVLSSMPLRVWRSDQVTALGVDLTDEEVQRLEAPYTPRMPTAFQ